MPQISATGQLTGAAIQDWTTQAAGTFSTGDSGGMKCTVTGTSPAGGNVHVLNLITSKVEEKLGTDKPGCQCVGAFDNVFCAPNYSKTGLSTLAKNLSAVSVGECFQLSGNLHMKVDVLDAAGDPVACPSGAGYNWTWNTTGTTVAELVDTTSVEVCPGSPVDIKLV